MFGLLSDTASFPFYSHKTRHGKGTPGRVCLPSKRIHFTLSEPYFKKIYIYPGHLPHTQFHRLRVLKYGVSQSSGRVISASFNNSFPASVKFMSNKGTDGAERGAVFPRKYQNPHLGVIFWTVGTAISGRLQEARKSS